MKTFWDLSVGEKRKLETEDAFYEMLKTAREGVANFVYWPEALKGSKSTGYKVVRLHFSDCSFAFTKFEKIDFYNCRFSNCKFNHCEFNNCNFHDCEFTYANMFRVRVSNCYLDPNSFASIIPNFRDFAGAVRNANMPVSFFQTLLNNARDTGKTEFEKNAEYHFKKWKGLNLIQKKFTDGPYSDKLSNISFARKFVPSLIQYIVTGYGYKVGNFLMTFLVVFSAFFCINHQKWRKYNLEKKDVDIACFNKDTPNVYSSLFYTLDGTTKVVDSQMHPKSNEGMVWLSIQGVFGLFLFGGLITIVQNKYVK